jgi:hypothetical protein
MNAELEEQSYRYLLKNPIRKKIIESIMSRPKASTTKQIFADLKDHSRNAMHHHLRVLIKCNIIATDTSSGNKNLHFYRIEGDDELQELLQELFPNLYYAAQ